MGTAAGPLQHFSQLRCIIRVSFSYFLHTFAYSNSVAMKLLLILFLCLAIIEEHEVRSEEAEGCSFSDEELCGYSNLFDGNNGPKWQRQQFVVQPGQHYDYNHYYGQNYRRQREYTMEKPPKGEYFVSTGPTGNSQLAQKVSQLKSPPVIVNLTGKCLYFAYHNRLPISLTPSLIVFKRNENDSENNLEEEKSVLAEFYSSESPKWFEVQVPLPEGQYSLIFSGRNYNNRTLRGGEVAITNIAIKDGSCAKAVHESLESPGDCDFEGTRDECGYMYTNDSTVKLLQIYAESLSAHEQSQRSVRKPPDDRFLAMTSKFHEVTNHGNKVRLMSPAIITQKDGCVYLWYYNSIQSRTDENNALNIFQLETMGEKLLFRLPILKTQRDRWYQLNGALPRGTYRLIFEVVYTTDFAENDYVGFDNVEIFNKSCSDVKLMADVCDGEHPEGQMLCSQGGTCVNIGKKSYRCSCSDGYYGKRCEHKYPCTGGSDNNCLNGGTCVPDGKLNYNCTCQAGFKGERCEKIVSCGSPAEIVRHAKVVSYTDETYRSTARFECIEGWMKQGELVGTCNAQGRWEVQGRCLYLDCNDPPNLSQMTLVSVTNTTVNGRAIYRCQEGLISYENQDFLICQAVQHQGYWIINGDDLLGRWTRSNTNDYWNYGTSSDGNGRRFYYYDSSMLPCRQIPNCGNPPPVGNANLTVTSTLMYGVASYRCIEGYEMNLNLTVLELNCSQDGSWTNKAGIYPYSVQCLMLPDCRAPPQVPNSTVTYKATTVNSVAHYTCEKGYRLVGGDSANCWKVGANRLVRWVDWLFVPTCEPVCPVKIGRPGNFTMAKIQVSHCTLSGSGTFSGDLSCRPGINYTIKRKLNKKSEERNEEKIVFYGSDLCIAEPVYRIKRFGTDVVGNVTRCNSICLQTPSEIRDIVVYEELVSTPISSSPPTTVYQTTRIRRIIRYEFIHVV